MRDQLLKALEGALLNYADKPVGEVLGLAAGARTLGEMSDTLFCRRLSELSAAPHPHKEPLRDARGAARATSRVGRFWLEGTTFGAFLTEVRDLAGTDRIASLTDEQFSHALSAYYAGLLRAAGARRV